MPMNRGFWLLEWMSRIDVAVWVALAALLLVVVLVYAHHRVLRARRRRVAAEAQWEGHTRAARRFAKEMGLSVETFDRLASWVYHQASADETWPYVTTLSQRTQAKVRTGTLAEIRRRYPQPGAAIRAIYFGAQATQDERLRRQWEQLVQRFQ